jgi:uncharacterized protein YidB (DUF937 family)
MSLLDTLGSMLGGGQSPQGGGQAALIAAALEFINNQPGGLNGLIQRFQQNGAGDIINSWVSTGENQPIAADTLHNVLGSEAVANMASKVGVEPSMVTVACCRKCCRTSSTPRRQTAKCPPMWAA